MFLADWRGRHATDAGSFAEAARFVALFYDGLVVPGALLIAASGLWLMHELALGFFGQPWLVGMWGLFVFEFVEGNTITRRVYRRTMRQAQGALAATAPSAPGTPRRGQPPGKGAASGVGRHRSARRKW